MKSKFKIGDRVKKYLNELILIVRHIEGNQVVTYCVQNDLEIFDEDELEFYANAPLKRAKYESK